MDEQYLHLYDDEDGTARIVIGYHGNNYSDNNLNCVSKIGRTHIVETQSTVMETQKPSNYDINSNYFDDCTIRTINAISGFNSNQHCTDQNPINYMIRLNEFSPSPINNNNVRFQQPNSTPTELLYNNNQQQSPELVNQLLHYNETYSNDSYPCLTCANCYTHTRKNNCPTFRISPHTSTISNSPADTSTNQRNQQESFCRVLSPSTSVQLIPNPSSALYSQQKIRISDDHSFQSDANGNCPNSTQINADAPWTTPIDYEGHINECHCVTPRRLQPSEDRKLTLDHSFSEREQSMDSPLPLISSPINRLCEDAVIPRIDIDNGSTQASRRLLRSQKEAIIGSNGLFLVVSGLFFILSGTYGLILVHGKTGEILHTRLQKFFLHQSSIVSYAFLLWGFFFATIGSALFCWVYKVKRTPARDRTLTSKCSSVVLFPEKPMTEDPLSPETTQNCCSNYCRTSAATGQMNSSSLRLESTDHGTATSCPENHEIHDTLPCISQEQGIHQYLSSRQISIPPVTVIV